MAENSDYSWQETLLVRRKVYLPNCPGCKVEQSKELSPGFPTIHLFRIWVLVLTTALPISSLFPFLYFMIRDLHVAKTEEDIGYYAGYLGTSYMLGKALSSVLWELVADRYGRKPVIVIGTLTVVIFNSLFGLSVNYWMAISTRFLLGSLNGLLGAIKAYSTELFREEHQAIGMSSISTAWGGGLILGPALGGFLAQPADKFPSVFSKDSLFGRFPYFLPCFCVSVFAAGVMILSLWLPETLHNHNGNNNIPCNDSLEALEAETCVTDHENESEQRTEPKQKPKKSVLWNRPLMSSIIVYCVFSLHETAFVAILSLWAASPRKFGSLNFSSETIGVVLAISGSTLLVFQIFLWIYFEKFLGPVLVCRFARALTVPILTSFPYIAMLSGFILFLVANIVFIRVNN